MTTTAWIIVIVVVLVAAAVVAWLMSQQKKNKQHEHAEHLRQEAHEHAAAIPQVQDNAKEAEAKAEVARLEAERAAREAQEAKVAATQQEAVHEDRLRTADEVDPRVDTSPTTTPAPTPGRPRRCTTPTRRGPTARRATRTAPESDQPAGQRGQCWKTGPFLSTRKRNLVTTFIVIAVIVLVVIGVAAYVISQRNREANIARADQLRTQAATQAQSTLPPTQDRAAEAEARAAEARAAAERAEAEAEEARVAAAQAEAQHEGQVRAADRLDPRVDHRSDDYAPQVGGTVDQQPTPPAEANAEPPAPASEPARPPPRTPAEQTGDGRRRHRPGAPPAHAWRAGDARQADRDRRQRRLVHPQGLLTTPDVPRSAS